MKFGLNHYYKPTPVKLRKIGDALLGISTFIAGYGITANIKAIAISGLVAGIAGKFLTTMFTTEENHPPIERP
jgi:hypothetical protein